MSSLLEFQMEGPEFESHQGNIFFILFCHPIVLKKAKILMNVVFLLIKTEISTCGTFSSNWKMMGNVP